MLDANYSYYELCNHGYMDDLGNRLKKLREGKKLSQKEIADKIGISRVAVSKWENGQTSNIKFENLLSLCKLFDITVEELIIGERHRKGARILSSSSTFKISESLYKDSSIFNILDVRADCGDGAINQDYPDTIRALIMSPEEAQRLIGSQNRNDNIQVIIANKDSMSPAINPDDLLFVDTSVKDYSGEAVYILLHGGELVCKRLSLVGRVLTVSSDNKAYSSWSWVERPDETKIVGRVIRALPMNFKNFGTV